MAIARKLESYGYDMLNCNSGTYDSFYYACPPYYQPYGYNLELSRAVKAAVNIPVFIAGKMDDPDVAEEAVASGATDGVALARGSLADPAFAKKLEMGTPERNQALHLLPELHRKPLRHRLHPVQRESEHRPGVQLRTQPCH